MIHPAILSSLLDDIIDELDLPVELMFIGAIEPKTRAVFEAIMRGLDDDAQSAGEEE